MNIAANLDHAAFHFPDHCAVIEGDRSVAFSEFNRDANQIASALVGVGVQPGDHIVLCAPNSYAWLVFYFGVLKAGAVAVTFSHLLTKHELSRTIADPEYRERVTAFIVPQRGHHIDPVSLREYLKTRMAAFKVPKEYITVEDLPKSGVGKMLAMDRHL